MSELGIDLYLIRFSLGGVDFAALALIMKHAIAAAIS